MTSLIAVIGNGKGTWGQVSSLINSKKWDKIYLICNEFTYKNFQIDPNLALKLKIDEKNLENNLKTLSQFFKKNINDFEIALNIISGNGFEHMITIASILKAGLGIRFIYSKDKNIKELKLFENQFTNYENE